MSHHKTAVQDWMTKEPVTVSADTSLINAYALMERRKIRRLPVVDENALLIGILTRSDIQQVAPFFKDDEQRVDAMFALAGMTTGEVMTANPVVVKATDTIQVAAKQMITARVSGLPVVNEGRVVGIITESDIFRFVVESWESDS